MSIVILKILFYIKDFGYFLNQAIKESIFKPECIIWVK